MVEQDKDYLERGKSQERGGTESGDAVVRSVKRLVRILSSQTDDELLGRMDQIIERPRKENKVENNKDRRDPGIPLLGSAGHNAKIVEGWKVLSSFHREGVQVTVYDTGGGIFERTIDSQGNIRLTRLEAFSFIRE